VRGGGWLQLPAEGEWRDQLEVMSDRARNCPQSTSRLRPLGLGLAIVAAQQASACIIMPPGARLAVGGAACLALRCALMRCVVVGRPTRGRSRIEASGSTWVKKMIARRAGPAGAAKCSVIQDPQQPTHTCSP
jgi:hypothetical protein